MYPSIECRGHVVCEQPEVVVWLEELTVVEVRSVFEVAMIGEATCNMLIKWMLHAVKPHLVVGLFDSSWTRKRQFGGKGLQRRHPLGPGYWKLPKFMSKGPKILFQSFGRCFTQKNTCKNHVMQNMSLPKKAPKTDRSEFKAPRSPLPPLTRPDPLHRTALLFRSIEELQGPRPVTGRNEVPIG